jgi:hypothetical protein
MIAANVLNKQSGAADKGGLSAWGLGEVLTTPHREIFYKASRLEQILWYKVSNDGRLV